MRPFVYRMLVPALSRMLIYLFHLRIDHAVWIIYAGSALGFYYAARYLILAFTDDNGKAAFLAALCHELIYIILFKEGKIYDMATAFFFTLCLAFLARRKFVLYCIVFVVASLNRETTFILAIFFAVYFIRHIPFRQYFYMGVFQFMAYFMIRAGIMAAFANRPGTAFLLRPAQNIRMFLDDPISTTIILASAAILFIFIFHKWEQKSYFLRSAFFIMVPIQIILHLMMGWGMELRVYAETFPIMILLAGAIKAHEPRATLCFPRIRSQPMPQTEPQKQPEPRSA